MKSFEGDAVKVTFPRFLVFLSCFVCIFPAILNLCGFDFSSEYYPFDASATSGMSPVEIVNRMFFSVRGDIIHTFLEWTAYCTAIFTFCLAFVHFLITRDIITLTIALALLSSGFMDAFHTLATARLINVAVDNRNFISFTWSASRLFHAFTCLSGILFLQLAQKIKLTDRFIKIVISMSFIVGASCFFIIYFVAKNFGLPPTMFPDASITRPWDIVPLLLYIISIFVFYRFHKKNPSTFTHALLIGLIPNIAVQIYTTFGSDAFIDNRFNISFFLKIFAYFIPFMGLLIDYIRTYNEEKKTIQKLNEQRFALKLAKEEAVAALRTKSDFLSNVSHEIRTPLNSIIGVAEILKGQSINESQKRYIDLFERSSESLLALINDILDVSKIEAGELKVEYIKYNLRLLVGTIGEISEVNANKKDLEFHWTIDSAVSQLYLGDPTRVRQVINNLVNNAIKFTKKGSIKLSVNVKESYGDFHELLFCIADTGIGIPEDKIEMLFQPFTQANSSTTREFGGTGLGLAICNQLSRMMGGEVWAISQEGKGTKFYFTIKTQFAENGKIFTLDQAEDAYSVNATVKILPQHFTKKIKVLVAEDFLDNQLVLKLYLQDYPIELVFVDNGEKAVHEFKGQKFDLILMDMQMPVMDGGTATMMIREWEKNNQLKPTPIFAFTANAMKDEEKKSLALGCDKHLSKPVRKMRLLKEIMEATNQKLPVEQKEVIIVPPKPIQKENLNQEKINLDDIEEELIDYIPEYLQNRFKDLEELKKLSETHDFKNINQICHRILGTARSYGLIKLEEIISSLKDYSHKSDSKKIQDQTEELSQYLETMARKYPPKKAS